MDKAGFSHAYDPGALKVTISKFYRPNGASTQLRGVASDIVLPSPSDLSDVNESSLKRPVALGHRARRAPRATESGAALSQHPAREIPRADRARKRSSPIWRRISLGSRRAWPRNRFRSTKPSAGRRWRRSRPVKRQRKQDELAHPTSQPTTYEITLKNASSPGLPPPMAPKKSADRRTPGATLPPRRTTSTSRHSATLLTATFSWRKP